MTSAFERADLSIGQVGFLAKIKEITEGKILETNIALIKHNAL